MDNKTIVIYGGSEEKGYSDKQKSIRISLENFFETNRDKIEKILFGGSTKGTMGMVHRTAIRSNINIEGYSTEEYRKYDEGNGVELTFFKTEEERQKAFIEKGDLFLGLPGGNGTTNEILVTLNDIASKSTGKKIYVSEGFRAFKLYHDAQEEDGNIAKRDRGIIEIIKKVDQIKL